MATVFDVPANELIEEAARRLREEKLIEQPDWAAFVKTACTKERPPQRDDWWFVRAASILRTLYVRGKPVGVSRLRTKYGAKTKSRSKPKEFKKGSGKIIRTILQQLEKIGFVQQVEKPRKGRIITDKGKSFLDKIAAQILKQKGK